MNAFPESGALDEVPLPRLLLHLYQTRFNGSLDVARQKAQKSFLFQDGAPVGSDSNQKSESLCVVLEDAGVLATGDRALVDEHIRKKGCAEGVALMALGLAKPTDIFSGLREQVRRRIVECFSWVNGDYALVASEERRDDVQALRVDPYTLIQKGLETHWPLERMLGDLQPSMGRYAASSDRLGPIARRMTLDATVERMIAGMNGLRTLGASMGASMSSPTVASAFWVLDAAGALDYSDSPRTTEDEAPPDIEIEITGAPAAAVASEGPAPKEAAASDASAAVNPEAEKMRAEVLDRLENLDSLTFYQLLGVESDAPHAAIRKAYFLAAKRYHPDAFVRLGLQDLRSAAGDVFSKIAEANEVLADPKRRAAYDRSLEGGGDVDVTVLRQAETFYRKGEILIKMGDFRGALEYLQNAVALYPDEAVYQSDLAWAYYKKSPPEPEPALEHINKALQLDPSDSVAQFRVGVIERAIAEG